MSTDHLAAKRLHRDDSGDFFLQNVDDRRAVGLVLDQLSCGLGPLGGKPAHGIQRFREAHAATHLIEQIAVCAFPCPDLSNNEV